MGCAPLDGPATAPILPQEHVEKAALLFGRVVTYYEKPQTKTESMHNMMILFIVYVAQFFTIGYGATWNEEEVKAKIAELAKLIDNPELNEAQAEAARLTAQLAEQAGLLQAAQAENATLRSQVEGQECTIQALQGSCARIPSLEHGKNLFRTRVSELTKELADVKKQLQDVYMAQNQAKARKLLDRARR